MQNHGILSLLYTLSLFLREKEKKVVKKNTFPENS